MRATKPNFLVIARISMLRDKSPRIAPPAAAAPDFYAGPLYWPVTAAILAIGLTALTAVTR